ncbi:hypothetical protein ABT299_11880 [Spirillospora sp. NPDC000708]
MTLETPSGSAISFVAALAVRDWVLLLIALSVVVVLFGVLLPAVWSSKPARRQAARAVLEAVLQWSLDLLVPSGRRGRR